jgi:catechol 2,3-dioxygenase-like lactoylglutathione lyase family enzyme
MGNSFGDVRDGGPTLPLQVRRGWPAPRRCRIILPDRTALCFNAPEGAAEKEGNDAGSPVGPCPARNAGGAGKRGPGILPGRSRHPGGGEAFRLAARGGCWFEDGELKIHLGVEKNFVPAKKAHPAFIVDDLTGLEAALKRAGYPIAHDEPLAGYDRLFVSDPFGNRIELMQVKAS